MGDGVAAEGATDIAGSVWLYAPVDSGAPAMAMAGSGMATAARFFFSGVSRRIPTKVALTAPPRPQMLTMPKVSKPSTGTM